MLSAAAWNFLKVSSVSYAGGVGGKHTFLIIIILAFNPHEFTSCVNPHLVWHSLYYDLHIFQLSSKFLAG